MGTVLMLHKRNKMKHKNRPHIAPMLHTTCRPHAPFLFVSDCPDKRVEISVYSINRQPQNIQSRIITISDFYASKLNNHRSIHIYLPSGYDMEIDKRYPVLYMHDGQNIFDPSASSSGTSWKIHHTADKLISEGKIRKLIIVGIEFKERGKEFSHSSWNRKKVEWNEYAHFEYTVDGKGALYEDFIVNELKPYIDKNFRTLPEKENTALMGGSSGGLVTLNIGIRHPEIFNMLGIISPAFFAMDLGILSGMKKKSLKMWFDTGEKEPCLLEDTKHVVDLLKARGYAEGKELIYYQVPDGFHSDKDWGERAEGTLIFFFGKMGEPVHAELAGRDEIGLDEDAVRINPVIYYNSGLIRSDLSASYIVENPEILEIKPDGTIIPKMEGTSRVEYKLNSIKVSKMYKIIKGLSKTVKIDIDIKVPESTPEEAILFVDTYSPVNLPMEKVSKGFYRGTFHLPRGLNVNYRLKMIGKNQINVEKDMDLHDIPFRHLYAIEDSEIHCIVNNWA